MRIEAKDGEATLWIYDAIGDMFGPDAVTAKGVRDRLAALRGINTLNIRINSPGGVVDDAVAIHTLLSEYPAEKVTKIDGVAASAATILIPRDSKVQIASGAKMMIHNPWGIAVGDYRELAKASEIAKKYAESAAEMYLARTGKTSDEVRAAMDAETWFTGQEAVDFGIADSSSETPAIEAATQESVMAKAKLVAQLAFAAMVAGEPEQRQATFNSIRRAAVALARARGVA